MRLHTGGSPELVARTNYGSTFALHPYEVIDSFVLHHGYYESEIIEALRPFFGSQSVFWDIGASFGLHAIMRDGECNFLTEARLLDAGGWFKPWPLATHVVDLMPYETRGGRLQLSPQRGERFTKATWTQLDFLEPGLRLPFSDGFFDYAFCGHTIEDLENPEPLLRELTRVTRAGCVETPSRLAEQTTGIRDRVCDAQGYGHHHWIVDVADGTLELSPKSDSLPPGDVDHQVPLLVYERRITAEPAQAVTRCTWENTLRWRFVTADVARVRARDYARSLSITPHAIRRDWAIRRLRSLKRKWFHPAPPAIEDWWERMLALSQPYSALPLCPRSQ